MVLTKAIPKKLKKIRVNQSIFKGMAKHGLKRKNNRRQFQSDFRRNSQNFLNKIDIPFVMHIAVYGVSSPSLYNFQIA